MYNHHVRLLYPHQDMPPSLLPVVANILQEFADVFPSAVPPGLPPIRGIEHQIDLIPVHHYRTVPLTVPTLRRLKRFSDKFKNYSIKVIFVSLLVHVLFQLFWYLRKMVLPACVLIVGLLIISQSV